MRLWVHKHFSFYNTTHNPDAAVGVETVTGGSFGYKTVWCQPRELVTVTVFWVNLAATTERFQSQVAARAYITATGTVAVVVWLSLALLALPFFVLSTAAVLLTLTHELGHFWVARRLGFTVPVIQVGVGPLLWSVQLGGTVFKLKALFFVGGGTHIDGSPKGWRSVAISLAGPAASLCAGVVLLLSAFCLVGEPTPTLDVSGVRSGSPAAVAGVVPGDSLIGLNGLALTSWTDLDDYLGNEEGLYVVASAGGETVTFSTQVGERSGLYTKVTPQTKGLRDGAVSTYRTLSSMTVEPGTWLRSSTAASSATSFGPIALAAFMSWVVFGLIQLLPLPPFDGGNALLAVGELAGTRAGKSLSLRGGRWYTTLSVVSVVLVTSAVTWWALVAG